MGRKDTFKKISVAAFMLGLIPLSMVNASQANEDSSILQAQRVTSIPALAPAIIDLKMKAEMKWKVQQDIRSVDLASKAKAKEARQAERKRKGDLDLDEMVEKTPLTFKDGKHYFPLKMIDSYYEDLEADGLDWSGVIKPTEEINGEQRENVLSRYKNSYYDLFFDFSSDSKWNMQILPASPMDTIWFSDNNLFDVDVKKFNELYNAENFEEAKEKYFSNRVFNTENQQYSRPFHYMSYWSGLPHPPVKKLDKNLELSDYIKNVKNIPVEDDHKFFDPKFQQNLDEISDTELTFGNELELLANGVAFENKLRMVREAKDYFFGSVLYLACDDSTSRLVEEMRKAVDRGVDVRMAIMATFIVVEKPCVRKMRKAGVKVLGISDILNREAAFGVYHNKVWIRDGEEAIVGGQNLMDAENMSTGFNHFDRDTDLLISKGPAVTDVVEEYAELWNEYRVKSLWKKLFHNNQPRADKQIEWAKEKKAAERKAGVRGTGKALANYKAKLSDQDARLDGVCRVLVQRGGVRMFPLKKDMTEEDKRNYEISQTDPLRGYNPKQQPIGPVLKQLIDATRYDIKVTSPTLDFEPAYMEGTEYEKKKDQKGAFMWNNQVMRALLGASEKGAKVKFLTNSFDGGEGELSVIFRDLYDGARAKENKAVAKTYKNLLYKFNTSRSKGFREGQLYLADHKNVDVSTYFQYTHSKIYQFDQFMVSVGAWNLDTPSAEKSHEAQVFCMDKKLASQMDTQLALDFINAIPVIRTASETGLSEKEEKKAEREAKKAEKQAERMAKKEAKKAEKEAKKAEREAKKATKRANRN